ncbi:P-II family nitrogen regulator [Clostridium manihotivorum]|uniref:P-II family nitrogen regulator n=1 Tax=Clostridium manihotivorum TaxID=2320868 RepID=A0A3R5QW48_9CLOT|nr:P-II family nitrogen regulator [Clostridium manihotivorum]QAA33629.1 P-II family nitrogen regulator [Clostridium manihotivorum]
MREVVAIIRMNMVNKTKEALLKEGIAAVTCRKVVGRGRKKVDFSIIGGIIDDGSIESSNVGENISEIHRLIPKRMLELFVKDEDVEKVINTIMEINSHGNPGDGKIFVMNVFEAVRIRTGEIGTDAI